MSIKTTKSIKTVGLVGKPGDKEAGRVISGLCEFLRSRGLAILLEEGTAAIIEQPNAPSRSLAQIGREIDLAIVIGGDGTLLAVARNLAPHGVPLVGVNVGRLGFLADISADNMLQVIGNILDGDFQQEERFLLDAEIVRDDTVAHRANAFNDVVVNKGELARLIELAMYIDGHFVSSTRADGIIVATPTGSTAYALSAGGPILHPTLPAIVLVPICPHTLSHRPLAVNSSALIELELAQGQSAYVTFDGQSFCSLQEGDRIRVRRADTPVTLIHPSNRNHYEVLRMKLHWGRQF
jgi:NAD+ kinase